MSSLINLENKLNVEPILDKIGIIIKNGLKGVITDYMVDHLTTELEKSQKLVEYYKRELEFLKPTITIKEEKIDNIEEDCECIEVIIKEEHKCDTKHINISLNIIDEEYNEDNN